MQVHALPNHRVGGAMAVTGAQRIKKLQALYPQHHDAIPAVLAHCNGSLETAVKSLRVISREMRQVIDSAKRDVQSACVARYAEYKQQQQRGSTGSVTQVKPKIKAVGRKHRSLPVGHPPPPPPRTLPRRSRTVEPRQSAGLGLDLGVAVAGLGLDLGPTCMEYQEVEYESPVPCRTTRETTAASLKSPPASKERQIKGVCQNRHPGGTRQQADLVWDSANDTHTHSGVILRVCTTGKNTAPARARSKPAPQHCAQYVDEEASLYDNVGSFGVLQSESCMRRSQFVSG